MNGHVTTDTDSTVTTDHAEIHGCNNTVDDNALPAGVKLKVYGSDNIVEHNMLVDLKTDTDVYVRPLPASCRLRRRHQ